MIVFGFVEDLVRATALSFVTLAAFLTLSAGCIVPTNAQAVDPAIVPAPGSADVAPAAPNKLSIPILMARELRDVQPPLSLLDLPPPDEGVAGGKLAIADNNTTGRFLNQDFSLEIVENAKPEALVAAVLAKVADGQKLVVVDASAATILMLSDALKDRDVMLFNASAPDDSLREAQCRPNVMHTAPTRSMLTDALTQYLVWKKWTKWFLVTGTLPEDKAYADELRRSAKRFGATIVEERTFQYDPGSRRSDGGFEQIQQQIPTFTQGAKPHDVVMVADEGELFGEYLPYRTWDPRPVAGTAGLIATPWHPALELWGGTQFQNRFKRLANRIMRPLDYNVWLAVRAIGEAASRKRTGDFKELVAYMRSKDFELAGFKGVKTTFRDWNGQLRQPLLVATPKLLVSVSPQPVFLHQFTELDTLGYDRPETKCKAYQTK
jgi:ABC transporter substrate binding protein (PQQ-dependent alcohol dehydrogenase system)